MSDYRQKFWKDEEGLLYYHISCPDERYIIDPINKTFKKQYAIMDEWGDYEINFTKYPDTLQKAMDIVESHFKQSEIEREEWEKNIIEDMYKEMHRDGGVKINWEDTEPRFRKILWIYIYGAIFGMCAEYIFRVKFSIYPLIMMICILIQALYDNFNFKIISKK